MTGATSALSTETVLELLSDARRRRLLAVLAESPGEDTTLAALADELPAASPECDGGSTRERVAVDLHHVHLPKLAAAGVIDYDARSGRVRYRGDDVVEQLLTAVVDERDPGPS